jgi:hypothetical protein
MAGPFDEFIPLERTFHELTLEAGADDNSELTRSRGLHTAMSWPDLLKEHRTIVLSEAGSGKTTEIRNTAVKLRESGKQAFFVRIEHVVHSFEDSFEEGTVEQFRAWASSGEEGWLLLDSVDEARLHDPKDFERAIKALGRHLGPILEQAHIVITGRTSAWRVKTDLLLCRSALPYHGIETSADDGAPSDTPGEIATKKKGTPVSMTAPFKIVALDNLHGDQVDAFLRGMKVADPKAFKDAVERKEVMSLTTRPQDLAELVEFWNKHERIGSRLELLRSSIDRRLEERDQDRSELRPIAIEKLRFGARLVAAAATLTRESSIRVPDGASNSKGISIRDVLPDWDDIDCGTLLSRPIFDNGIYGTVRFHHRSVREYLAAEWLYKLIVDDASRARVEALFFRWQYGIEVIVPTMRPVLAWLVILDVRILTKVCRVAPEVIFEGGDPSQLPRETRSNILRQVCEQLTQPAHGRSLTDYASVQRFANEDLTADVRTLLDEYAEDDDIVSYLLRMVCQGEIKGAAPEAKRFSLTSRTKYTRIAALRALVVVGSAADQAEVRHAFLADMGEINRDWLAELIPGLPAAEASVIWILTALERAPAKQRFEYDSLLQAMLQIATDWPLPLLGKLVAGIYTLLETPPVIERRYCEVSAHYAWLAPAAAKYLLRLANAKAASTLELPSLSLLRLLPVVAEFGEQDLKEMQPDLGKAVTEWPDLNYSLFWQNVEVARAARAVSGERTTAFWQAVIFGHFWMFGADQFDSVCDDINKKPLPDDRMVAMSLAFAIYRENGKPTIWREKLKRIAKGEPALKLAIHALLKPPPEGKDSWRAEQARWKKRAERDVANAQANRQKWKESLKKNIDALRGSEKPGVVTNGQYYLNDRMKRGSESSGKWSDGNWESLIPEYGPEVARAFRDGAVSFWRGYLPQLISEGTSPNTTPLAVIFGLTGLAIEARESTGWPQALSLPDAERALRYALRELNGFSSWLPSLYTAFPEIVIHIVSSEIDYELGKENDGLSNQGVLYAASWRGEWMWDRLAPLLVTRLNKPPRNVGSLRSMLNIIGGSPLDNVAIAQLASRKAKTTKNLESASMWFAAWVGVAPAVGIPALAARLAEIPDGDNQSRFAMRFLTALMGGRGERGRAREGYRTVEYSKALYLLMNDYIREEDDIDRIGKGVYSPELRDNAQDARNALLSFIRETPGKDAFLALMDISRAHPTETSRPWVAFHAKEKATLDADSSAWSPQQVRDFHDQLDRTPTNHRDLWYLAIDRLLDLKNDLEEGDSSIASILQPVGRETEIRKFIGNWCRERAAGRYSIPQEEELADAKKPDLRFHGVGFDGPVPAELKLADKWTGPHLFERLEVQLCGDYLRDKRSSRGIFLLVYHGERSSWDLPQGGRIDRFEAVVEALQNHWTDIAAKFPGVEDIRVIGIDLTKRGLRAKAASTKRRVKKAVIDGAMPRKRLPRK